MITTTAVIRLPQRLAQVMANERQVEVVQERAVVEEIVTLPLLGIAGELAPHRRQVADTRRLDALHNPAERRAQPAKNIGVGRSDFTQLWGALVGEDQRVKKAATSE